MPSVNTEDIIRLAAEQGLIDSSVMAISEVTDAEPGTYELALYNGKVIRVTLPQEKKAQPKPEPQELSAGEGLEAAKPSSSGVVAEAAAPKVPPVKKAGKPKQ